MVTEHPIFVVINDHASPLLTLNHSDIFILKNSNIQYHFEAKEKLDKLFNMRLFDFNGREFTNPLLASSWNEKKGF